MSAITASHRARPTSRKPLLLRSGWIAVAASARLTVAGATAAPALAQSFDQMARSPRGVVVSPHRLATQAGLSMLEAGGNAADAAVAAAFALCVLEPSTSSIGGGSHILVRTPEGDFYGIDGAMLVPADGSAAGPPTGYGAIGVPGTVAALMRLHAQRGALSLERVLAPAIEYAEEGFRIQRSEAQRLAAVATDLRGSAGARATFLPRSGPAFRSGQRLAQPDLAAGGASDGVRLIIALGILEQLDPAGLDEARWSWAIAGSLGIAGNDVGPGTCRPG